MVGQDNLSCLFQPELFDESLDIIERVVIIWHPIQLEVASRKLKKKQTSPSLYSMSNSHTVGCSENMYPSLGSCFGWIKDRILRAEYRDGPLRIFVLFLSSQCTYRYCLIAEQSSTSVGSEYMNMFDSFNIWLKCGGTDIINIPWIRLCYLIDLVCEMNNDREKMIPETTPQRLPQIGNCNKGWINQKFHIHRKQSVTRTMRCRVFGGGWYNQERYLPFIPQKYLSCLLPRVTDVFPVNSHCFNLCWLQLNWIPSVLQCQNKNNNKT